MIFCVGDSHACIFGGGIPGHPKSFSDYLARESVHPKIPGFKSFRLMREIPSTKRNWDVYGMLSYNVLNKIDMIDNVLKIGKFDKDKDKLLFCFGEVDCRAHIKKQADMQNKDARIIIQECVERYFASILYYKVNRKIDVMVWGPHAPWSENQPYDGPTFGTEAERIEINRIFNEILEDRCALHKIPFVSVFSETLIDETHSNDYYLDDAGIHLNERAIPLILDKFKNKNLI